MTLTNTPFHKLVASYYGPFKVFERIGKVAYKLELQPRTKIHDVFHVSLLKQHHGKHNVSKDLPVYNEDGDLWPKPLAVLDTRMKKKTNRAITEVLIQWQYTNPEKCCLARTYLQQLFPYFNWNATRPCGQVL